MNPENPYCGSPSCESCESLWRLQVARRHAKPRVDPDAQAVLPPPHLAAPAGWRHSPPACLCARAAVWQRGRWWCSAAGQDCGFESEQLPASSVRARSKGSKTSLSLHCAAGARRPQPSLRHQPSPPRDRKRAQWRLHRRLHQWLQWDGGYIGVAVTPGFDGLSRQGSLPVCQG